MIEDSLFNVLLMVCDYGNGVGVGVRVGEGVDVAPSTGSSVSTGNGRPITGVEVATPVPSTPNSGRGSRYGLSFGTSITWIPGDSFST